MVFSSEKSLGAEDAFGAIWFRTGVGQVIALAIDADDEHGTAVTVAFGLIGSENGRSSTLRSRVADALAEATMAELVGAAEEFDGEIGAVGGESGFHGAVMLVAKGKDVGPHRKRV
jgi:hypothetical protein